VLDAMDRIGRQLSEAERTELRSEAWRAWPDDYAKRMCPPRDVAVWNRKGASPRESRAA
jgi:hypothetical protein